MSRKCCICFTRWNKNNKRSFYRFPGFTEFHNKAISDKHLIERRRNLWLQLTKGNLGRCNGQYFVCSDHFVSGKPAYLYLTEDVDWVPTQNLGSLEQDNHFVSTHTDEEGQEISCDLSMTSTENDPLDVQTAVHPPDPNTTDGVTGCFVDGNKRPMVTIVSPELLRDTTFSENPSTAVQCAIDEDNRIIVKTEIMDMEDEVPLNTGPNLTYSLISTSMADNGTQVDFDEPPSPIQLDKSTQTEMSSFPKPRGTE
ncbi:uncharacterized protein LOC124313247 isoform X4 [Daphnia pulicaria]|uniref:uncharacterized protein LOC124313247 isoform X4 n=1 Tax=Daphnia pulicaria TaxID=35523 RepID=UPI001EEAFAA5|nr:uncharacterized protein LOC124313247 isoform X4 [Daphnia pulicaria]XP_046634025.1 uncharacterized protein LOC124313247 isoform X4 [Daphnia pulicaria]XP_046634026.1 uncharacterized protein LOC124313247 isoform X4 [Daphnia pulicaria]